MSDVCLISVIARYHLAQPCSRVAPRLGNTESRSDTATSIHPKTCAWVLNWKAACVGRFFDLSVCWMPLNKALKHVTKTPRCELSAVQLSTLPEIIWRNHVAESLRDSEMQSRGATLPHPFPLKLVHGCLAGQRHVSDGFLISGIARYGLTASHWAMASPNAVKDY